MDDSVLGKPAAQHLNNVSVNNCNSVTIEQTFDQSNEVEHVDTFSQQSVINVGVVTQSQVGANKKEEFQTFLKNHHVKMH